MLEELGRFGDEVIYRVVMQATDIVSTVDFVDKREAGLIHYRCRVKLSENALREIQRLTPKVYSSICHNDKEVMKSYKIERAVCQSIIRGPNDTAEQKEEKYREARKKLDSKWILRRDDAMESVCEELKTRLLQLFEKYNRAIISRQCLPMISKVAELEKRLGDCSTGDIAAEDFSQLCKNVEELKLKIEKEFERIMDRL